MQDPEVKMVNMTVRMLIQERENQGILEAGINLATARFYINWLDLLAVQGALKSLL